MKIKIEKNLVLIQDELGNVVHFSLDQFIEMVSLVNSAILDGDRLAFEKLEFTV